MDLISIIVPVYNVEKYLDRCMESLLNQTYECIEIILINDGSKDSSGMICDKYGENYSHVKVLHKKNAGLGFARNSGLELAKGKYVTFVDSDDYIGRNRIKNMYKLIKKTGTDTCITGYTKAYATRNVVHQNVCGGKVFMKNIKEEILPRMCGASIQGDDYIEMSVCMVLFSNEIIRKNNLKFVSERELVSEDIVFGFDYYPKSQGVCISDDIDYYYAHNEESLTTKYREDRFDSQVQLYKYLRKKSKNLNIENKCLPRLENTLIAIARYTIKLEYKFMIQNGKKNARANVRKICENEFLVLAINSYDDRKIKKTSRVVNYLIKRHRYLLLELTMMVKNRFGI